MLGNMLGDCGDTNTNQVCPCPKEAQKPKGERDLGKGKGTEGQLEMVLDKLVSEHVRQSPQL